MTELKKRRLGRTGLMVTAVGLGAMDTPTSREGPETLSTALDLGVNFVDTAREYDGSEFLIGRAVRERGAGGFHISSKTFSRTMDGSQRDVDRSLTVLGVESIDVYLLHDVSTDQAWDEVMGPNGALEGLKIARYRGLIQHIGLSSHNLDVLRRSITCGEFDAMMVEYSAFFPESATVIELAGARDIGVIAMRPVGGSGRASVIRGRISEGYSGLLTPAGLLRYVLTNEGVSVAIPGARYPSRVHENVTTAAHLSPMTVAERSQIEAEAAKLY